MEDCEEPGDETWKKFLRRHWQISLLMVAVIALAVIAAVSTFLLVAAEAQATGIVPLLLGEWTVGYFITFILTVILWEIIFVASWSIPIALILYFLWYKKLPVQERKEYKGRRRKSAGEDGGISFLCGIIWLAIIWLDGKWNLAFQEWAFNDWIYTWLAACLWTLLIVGIPGIIYVIWVLSRKSGQ